MSTAAKKLAVAIATLLFAFSVSLAAFAPASAQADEIDLQAAGHGAARVEDTYKNWVADGNLYSVLHYDVTYKVIGYTSGYTCLGTRIVGSWRSASPTAGLGAFGTTAQYQYLYSTY